MTLPFHRLRVNGTRFAGSAAPVGAATAYAALGAIPTAEIPTVYLRGTMLDNPIGMGGYHVEDPPALAPGTIVTYIQAGAEMAGLGGFAVRVGPDAVLQLWSVQPGPKGEALAFMLTQAARTYDPVGVWNRFEVAWTPNGLDLTTDPVRFLNNLYIVIGSRVRVWEAKPSDTGQLGATDAYVDLFYVERPTMTLTGPPAVVSDTSTPIVTWTVGQPEDGSGQSYWQLYVHTAAQVAALPGMNPTDPETPNYVSGPNVWFGQDWSSAVAVGIGTDLVEATTYRISGRIIQVTNGVNQLSPWAFRDIFVSLTPPASSFVYAVTPHADEGKLTVQVQIPETNRPDVLELQRRPAGTTTWLAVRSGTYAVPAVVPLTGGVRLVEYQDWDSGNGEVLEYRVRGINIGAGDASLRVATPWQEGGAAGMWSSTRTWLRDSLRPWLSSDLETMAGSFADVTAPARATTHEILGRADPIVVGDVRSSRSATVWLGIVDADVEAIGGSFGPSLYRRFLATIALGGTVTLLSPYTRAYADVWQRAYVTLGDVAESQVIPKADAQQRIWKVPIREMARPAGDYVVYEPPLPYNGFESYYRAEWAPWRIPGSGTVPVGG